MYTINAPSHPCKVQPGDTCTSPHPEVAQQVRQELANAPAVCVDPGLVRLVRERLMLVHELPEALHLQGVHTQPMHSETSRILKDNCMRNTKPQAGGS